MNNRFHVDDPTYWRKMREGGARPRGAQYSAMAEDYERVAKGQKKRATGGK